MKKRMTGFAVFALLFALAATTLVAPAFADALAGGWRMIETPIGTNDDALEAAYPAFEKAAERWTEGKIELVQPLATQVVAGINYLYVVQIPTGENTFRWALAKVYEDLSGNCEITEVRPIGRQTDAALAGGWQTVSEMPEDHFDLIWDALGAHAEEGTLVYGYLVLGTQVVAGLDYELLCSYVVMPEATEEDMEAAMENAQTDLALATVYVDLSGNAQVTAFEPVEF